MRRVDARHAEAGGVLGERDRVTPLVGGSVHRLAAPAIGWVQIATADADRVPAGPWMAWHEDGLRPPPS